jgi:alpha-tubulin suppressor-like RCC1 family protein
VRCWGDNSFGQLGDGLVETTRPTAGDVLIQGGGVLTGATGIAAASRNACALVSGGGIKCWGDNSFGQIGDGTTTSRPLAVDVLTSAGGNALTGAIAISGAIGSGGHFCATFSGGTVKCWGLNNTGQIGDGTTTNRLSPTDVLTSLGGSPLSGVTGIVSGKNHNCVLMAGDLKCWGSNDYGQLGDGTTTPRPFPTEVAFAGSGPPGVTAAAAGAEHTCVVVGGNGLRCWGYNGVGGLGDGTTTDRPAPVDVLASGGGILTGATGVGAGRSRTCALVSGGGVKSWGGSPIGDGDTTFRLCPVDVLKAASTPLTGATALGFGDLHTCAVISGGGLSCWGTNSVGQIGDGTTSTRLFATDVNVCP